MELIALLGSMAIRHQFGIRYSLMGTIYSDCETLVNYLLNRVSTRIKIELIKYISCKIATIAYGRAMVSTTQKWLNI